MLWSILFQQQENDECGLYSTREKKINELKRWTDKRVVFRKQMTEIKRLYAPKLSNSNKLHWLVKFKKIFHHTFVPVSGRFAYGSFRLRMAFLSLNLHEFPQFTIVVRRKEPQGSSSVIHFFYKQSAKTNYKKSARRPSPVKVFEVLRFPIRAFKLCSSHWWQLHQKMQTPINSLCSRNFTECLMSSSFLSIW